MKLTFILCKFELSDTENVRKFDNLLVTKKIIFSSFYPDRNEIRIPNKSVLHSTEHKFPYYIRQTYTHSNIKFFFLPHFHLPYRLPEMNADYPLTQKVFLTNRIGERNTHAVFCVWYLTNTSYSYKMFYTVRVTLVPTKYDPTSYFLRFFYHFAYSTRLSQCGRSWHLCRFSVTYKT